jgi:hypothetical protein
MKHAMAIAADGRDAKVCHLGEIETSPSAVERFVKKMESKARRLRFCDEAGPKRPGALRPNRRFGIALRGPLQ